MLGFLEKGSVIPPFTFICPPVPNGAEIKSNGAGLVRIEISSEQLKHCLMVTLVDKNKNILSLFFK